MSDARSISPWWVLLILPVSLLGGWFLGQMPVPKPQVAQAAAEPNGLRIPSRVESRRAEAASPSAFQEPADAPKRTEVSHWTTFDNALAESRRNGKPVLLDFNADWCPPCQAMKQQVFEYNARNEQVEAAVIPVSIVDRRREDGNNPPEIESLQQRYGVDAFPTLVVFNPASGQMVKTRGFGGADATLQWITEAAKQVR